MLRQQGIGIDRAKVGLHPPAAAFRCRYDLAAAHVAQFAEGEMAVAARLDKFDCVAAGEVVFRFNRGKPRCRVKGDDFADELLRGSVG